MAYANPEAHRDSKNEYNRAYYLKNRDRILERTRIWSKTRRPFSRTFNALSNLDYRESVMLFIQERDGHSCELCGHDILPGDEQIDHIVQRSIGGGNEPANLRLVHKTCNARRPRPRRKAV